MAKVISWDEYAKGERNAIRRLASELVEKRVAAREKLNRKYGLAPQLFVTIGNDWAPVKFLRQIH